MDILTPEQRRRSMVGNKSRDTKPELEIRRLLHSMGYRFRLQRGDLPGRPDIVLPRYKTVVFVHGCFWHHHSGCPHASTPSTNAEFWQKKFRYNIERDARNREALSALGWNIVIIWECEIKEILRTRIIPGLPARIVGGARTTAYPALAEPQEQMVAAESE